MEQDETLKNDIVYVLQYVKVVVNQGIDTHAGWLTDVSCDMIIAELKRRGLKIVRI